MTLFNILYCCHQSLLEVHDAVAFKTYSSPPPSPSFPDDPGPLNGFGGQPIRMVGLHKQPNKPLVSHTVLVLSFWLIAELNVQALCARAEPHC